MSGEPRRVTMVTQRMARKGPKRSPWRSEDRLLQSISRLVGEPPPNDRGGYPEAPPPVEETAKTLGVHALSRGVVDDVDLDLERGEYVLICFIEGHHLMGMLSPLTVTG